MNDIESLTIEDLYDRLAGAKRLNEKLLAKNEILRAVIETLKEERAGALRLSADYLTRHSKAGS